MRSPVGSRPSTRRRPMWWPKLGPLSASRGKNRAPVAEPPGAIGVILVWAAGSGRRLRPRDRGMLLDQGPGTPRSGKPDVLITIQALRGVAAFLVVFVHLETLASLAGAGPDTFAFGNSGVDLFFVISGLIMVVTTAGPNASAGRFMAHRIARIVPLYWTTTLFVFS